MTTNKNIIGKLLRIIRFPIKGFRGEEVINVSLKQGQGIPHDRRWAIRNGSLSPNNSTQGWEPCQAFIRMTQHEELPLYQMTNNDASFYLTHPNGERIAIQQNDDTNKKLSQWFTHKNIELSYSNNQTAYWDHQDAHISIINTTTIKAVSKTAGIELDPQRFRGNLLIETSEPWTELSLIGKRLSIGHVTLEILRPIDRCKATSINLVTGTSDINLPHLLSSQYGHIFCGVYARVISNGKLKKNDNIYNIGDAPEAIKEAIKPSTAPSPEQWPRSMRLFKRIKESSNTDSFWLEDPLASIINNIPPASYLRLHTEYKNKPLTRSYTISDHSPDGRYLRLTIKKESGGAKFSPWIHSNLHTEGSVIASGPFVDPSLTWRPHLTPQKEILIITAGIGVTIASSLILSLKHANYTAQVSVIHSVKYEKDAALWNEITKNINKLNNANACLFVTQEAFEEDTPTQKYGRMDISKILKNISLNNIQVFICGPQKFNQAINKVLNDKGFNSNDIHEDHFISPSTLKTPNINKATLTTSVPITFIHSTGKKSTITWEPEHGSLLDTAEANNISINANCRSGACRACLYAIEGKVENIVSPVSLAPKNWAYLCCAAPLTPLIIREKI